MFRTKLMVRLLPCFAISLTACHGAPVQTQVVTLPPPAIPAALLLPTEGPFRPPARATQRDAALVIEDFIESLAACNADKGALATIFKELQHGMAR